MIKKIITVLVLVMFVLSGSLVAYAQDRANDQRIGLDKSDMRADIARDKMKMRDALLSDKLQHRTDFKKHRTDFKKHCSDAPSDSVECTKARKDVAGSLNKVVLRLDEVLTELIDRLQKSDLSNKNVYIVKLEEHQDRLSDHMSDLKGDVRPDVLRKTRIDLHKTWKQDMRKDINEAKHALWKTRANKVVHRAEKIINSLKNSLDLRLKTDKALDSAKVVQVEEAIAMLTKDLEALKLSLRGDVPEDRRGTPKAALNKLREDIHKVVIHFKKLGHKDDARNAIAAASDIV